MAEVFAGFISYTDDQMGRVVDYLEQSGQLDNTLVVVISDNGASGEGGPNGSFNEWRFFNGIADSTELTLPHIDELGSPQSYNHYTHRVGLGLRHPVPVLEAMGGLRGRRGRHVLRRRGRRRSRRTPARRPQYVHAVDIVPTVYELLGIEPPDVLKGYHQSPIEGESFAASLTDAAAPAKETQFYAMLGQRSIYHQGWLACTVHPPISGWGNFPSDVWELYDLEKDRAQARNLAAEEPVRLETLKSLWYYYAGIYKGLPLDDRTALEQVLADRPHPYTHATSSCTSRTAPTSPNRLGSSSTDARTRSPPVSRSTRPMLRACSTPTVAWPAATASTSRTSGSTTRSTG